MVTSCSPSRMPSHVWTALGPRTGTVPSPDSILVRRWPRNFLTMCLLLFTGKEVVTVKGGRNTAPETQGLVCGGGGRECDKNQAAWAQGASLRCEGRVEFTRFNREMVKIWDADFSLGLANYPGKTREQMPQRLCGATRSPFTILWCTKLP